jgi:CRP/FNR family transcriptional regulator
MRHATGADAGTQDRRRACRLVPSPHRQHGDPEAESAGEISFDLPLTRADIADFLGLTIETVSRQLTKLRKDGLIAVENNRHITVFDLDRLERRANI